MTAVKAISPSSSSRSTWTIVGCNTKQGHTVLMNTHYCPQIQLLSKSNISETHSTRIRKKQTVVVIMHSSLPRKSVCSITKPYKYAMYPNTPSHIQVLGFDFGPSDLQPQGPESRSSTHNNTIHTHSKHGRKRGNWEKWPQSKRKEKENISD